MSAIAPVKDMPRYGTYLIQTVFSPILLFMALLGNLFLIAGMYVFYSNEVAINPQVNDWFDAFWWGMATVTTVGYGDIVPMTVEGKFAGVFLMLTGLVLFISYSAMMVSLFFARVEHDIVRTQTVNQAEFDAVMAEFDAVMAELRELKQEVQSLAATRRH